MTMADNTVWHFMRYYVIPFAFVLFFPIAVLLLVIHSQHDNLDNFDLQVYIGNGISWMVLTIFTAWAIIFLKVPSKQFFGPTTSFGYTPRYQANGFLYYVITVTSFVGLNLVTRKPSILIFDNIPQLLGSLNIVALLLCTFLLWRGKTQPQTRENIGKYPLIFEFYRGMEVHPRLWDMDVKQLTNCRIGLMAWQVLILAFWFSSLERNGWNPGVAVNVLLQSIYLAKFYWWETGYFNTLDITLDRAGFYICWGCLVFVPGFYTYTTFFLASHLPTVTNVIAFVLFLCGALSVLFNYLIDYEKEVFKLSSGQRTFLISKPKYVDAEYQSGQGLRRTRLLTSGFWGVSRHLNYVFELLLSFFWSLPGWNWGLWPFLYVIFLTILLVHRTYRDDDKCRLKYGKYWKKYCQIVKYKMIPYIF